MGRPSPPQTVWSFKFSPPLVRPIRRGASSVLKARRRAQVLYFLAENLEQRRDEFVAALAATGAVTKPEDEFEAAIRRCFWYAAQADKFDGAVTATKRNT